MNIGVIGYGVVGRATAEVLGRLGHTVSVGDTDGDRVEAAGDDGFGCLRRSARVDVLFVCVPEDNLHGALVAAPESRSTVIRSTVRPGTTDALCAELGRSLAYMPETLREATSLWDELNPPFLVIGCHDPRQGEVLTQLFAPLLAPAVIVPPATAEMVKLVLNAYLHTLISFWNEIHLICERTGVQSHVVGKLCSQDPRVSAYGASLHGKGVGGRCLPKDLVQIIAFAEGIGQHPELLLAVQRVNEKLTEHRNGASVNHRDPLKWPTVPVIPSSCLETVDLVEEVQ